MIDMSVYTEREVFDIVSKHLINQGKKSLRRKIGCAYKGRHGLKCAAGILIPDEHYSQDMEGLSWDVLTKGEFISTDHQSLIKDLQFIHDVAFPSYWEMRLAITSIKYFGVDYVL